MLKVIGIVLGLLVCIFYYWVKDTRDARGISTLIKGGPLNNERYDISRSSHTLYHKDNNGKTHVYVRANKKEFEYIGVRREHDKEK